MEDLTGKQLGPYRVVAQLGEGGMAAVYKAYQANMDRYVALKVLPQSLAKDPQFVERFKHEAQIVAKLQHPHILPVHDYGESEGYTYIVMPFIESGTLTDLMKGRPLPFEQIVSVISQVGDALDYAHSRGLVHRDVKPSNILLDPRGNCLLTDFGIARMVEQTQHFTQTGSVMGTPAYMSPEQGRGDKVDARSDIYALGIILYELATGRVPFKAETPIATIFKHIQDPLPLPHAFNPNIPEPIERIILKALAKNPADRFATAGDMVRTLKATSLGLPAEKTALASKAVPATVLVSAASALSQKSSLPKWVWLAGAAAVMVFFLGVAGILGLGALVALSGKATATPMSRTQISASRTPAEQRATATNSTGRATPTPALEASPSPDSVNVTPGLPADWPANIPIYPNAKSVQQNKIGTGERVGMFTSDDTREMVIKFYADQMPKNDWKLENTMTTDASGQPADIQYWTQNQQTVQVMISTQKEQTLLVIAISKPR